MGQAVKLVEFKDGSWLSLELVQAGGECRVQLKISGVDPVLEPGESSALIDALRDALDQANMVNVNKERAEERKELDKRVALTLEEYEAHEGKTVAQMEEEWSERYGNPVKLVPCPSEGCRVMECQGWRFERV